MKLILVVITSIFSHFFCWCQPQITEPKKLSFAINSLAEETTPVLSSNGQELYFVRTFDKNNVGGENDQDIWRSERNKNGEWNQAENVIEFNNQLHNSLFAISADNKMAFLQNSYDKKPNFLKSISCSKLDQNGDLKKPHTAEFNFEGIQGSISGFSISGDQKTIAFSANSFNNQSGTDLYYSEYKNNGWCPPIKLNFNTIKNEISPFLSEKGDTLYFASNGLPGFGNYDLFYSVQSKTSLKWVDPINMGDLINSPYFDAYLTKSGSTYFWSSNRKSNDSDLYSAEIKVPTSIKIELYKKDISFFNGNDGMIEIAIVSGTPPFKFKWSNGSLVKDLYKLRKGIYQVEVIDAHGQKITKTIELFEPQPELMSPLRLPEVQFEFGTWYFASAIDYDSLNTIADLLNKYPKMIVELKSHTDSRGDEQSNMKLSENRAKAVYTYLVNQKGIDGRRIIPIGKGETEPSFYWDPTTNQKINLSEAYIDKFKTIDPNFCEFLHQQNRRIEAQIISFDFDPISASPASKEYLIQPK